MSNPIALYPALADVLPSLAELGGGADPMAVPANTVLFDTGTLCQGFPLVLDGEVKVSRFSKDGS